MEELTELLDEDFGYVEEQRAEELAKKKSAPAMLKRFAAKTVFTSADPPDDDFFCANGEERKTKNIERINQQ